MSATGIVLAGGQGTRLGGGGKATVPLAGRPLLLWSLDALRAVCERVAVVAKRDTPLPPLDVPVWHEPEAPHHPRHGLVHALRRAGGPVLVVPVDLPLLDPPTLRALLAGGGVARHAGRVHPLLGVWTPAALPVLEAAQDAEPLRVVLERVPGRAYVDLADPGPLENVNATADLDRASARLRAG